MAPRTYFFEVQIAADVRDAVFSWAWSRFGSSGLQGIHEGTVLGPEAVEQGRSVEPWILDSGIAPEHRDWVGDQAVETVALYFDSEQSAGAARAGMLAGVPNQFPPLQPGNVQLLKEQDWDAEWKASFRGALVLPFWKVLPPWEDESLAPGRQSDGSVVLRLNPGAGFGTGTHETTQICLGLLAEADLSDAEVLDFGSGSGILSVAAALLGARVDAVEIDPLANDNARENTRMNGVETQIRISETLDMDRRYDVIVANILRPVLLEYCAQLVSLLKPGGRMILSGLIATDVEPVRAAYSNGFTSRVIEQGEWRGIEFSTPS